MTEDNTDSTTTTPPILEEVVWRDDLIRWEGGLNVDIKKKSDDGDDGDESSDDGQSFLIDPFADPDPFEMFHFDFDLPSSNNNTNQQQLLEDTDNKDEVNNNNTSRSISLQIRGYKTDAEQIWQSTGLTLWRASHYLCEYQVEHSELFQNKRVLELGAGLGLNGILTWRLSCTACVHDDESRVETRSSDESTSEVCITDGDSDALVHLRDNIERNRPTTTTDSTSKVSCHQLIWGKDSSQKFLQHIAHNQKYHVLLASDIIYSAVIVQPLWETVQTLLEKEGGVFIMAYARRKKVPVSIDLVLETAVEWGFGYELVKEDLEDGIWVYEFRFR